MSFSVGVYLIYMQCELKLIVQNKYGVEEFVSFWFGSNHVVVYLIYIQLELKLIPLYS
jgi:hypothetical protein